MSDLIDRQAVIDALHTWFRDGFEEDKWWNSTHVLAAIEGVPPAQPEIVRCKDCKHHRTHKCMDSIPIERCDLEQTFYDAEVDYCSLAERRRSE